MSYTPHAWANGQSGANAAPWLNNMEEGVRAATASAESTAALLDPAIQGSASQRAQALQQPAAQYKGWADNAYKYAQEDQMKLAERNTYLGLFNGTAGTGTDVLVTGMTNWAIGAFPMQAESSRGFTITHPGYYMFIINASLCGPSAKIKIRNHSTGTIIETLKLIGFNDVSSAQEWAIVSACVTKYLENNVWIDFLVSQDGSGAYLSGFRVIIRRL